MKRHCYEWSEITNEIVKLDGSVQDDEWDFKRVINGVAEFRSSRDHLSLCVMADTPLEAQLKISNDPAYIEWHKEIPHAPA